MRKLIWAVETTAATFLLLIAVLTAGNVFLRNTFNVTIPDWYDASRLILGIAMFWGIAVATYSGRHICVDLLWEWLGEPNRKRLDISATLIVTFFLAPMAVMTWLKVAGSGSQATNDLRIPVVWFYSLAAAGATACAILAAWRVWALHKDHDVSVDVEEVAV